ncbi:MAG: peptidylprolyl isomerase [Acidobacteria bacterium]|nr:peptidylprolyl isomerase [Acidobacteriota bacterium]
MQSVASIGISLALAIGGWSASAQETSPGAGPVVVIETAKGTIEFETYPEEAPKTVAHVLALVRRGFYNGHRFHRVEPNFVAQVGDPQTRDMTKRDLWGRGPASGSGKPIGVAEFSKKRPHRTGAVGMAHAGTASLADSQIYITKRATPELNLKYTVFGQVIAGMTVLEKIEVGDVVRKMSVREAPAR